MSGSHTTGRHRLSPTSFGPRGHFDPWQQALANARQQIRDFIEQGEIGFGQITEGWLAEWAADLLDAV